MMTPEVMYFFRDELEKQAIISPTTSVNWMKSSNPIVRQAGHLGGRIQRAAADLHPLVQKSLEATQQVNPTFGAATGTGGLVRKLLRRAGVSPGAATAMTLEGATSPYPAINPVDVQGPLAQKLMKLVSTYGPEALEGLGTLTGFG